MGSPQGIVTPSSAQLEISITKPPPHLSNWIVRRSIRFFIGRRKCGNDPLNPRSLSAGTNSSFNDKSISFLLIEPSMSCQCYCANEIYDSQLRQPAITPSTSNDAPATGGRMARYCMRPVPLLFTPGHPAKRARSESPPCRKERDKGGATPLREEYSRQTPHNSTDRELPA